MTSADRDTAGRFQVGNRASLKHGGRSPRERESVRGALLQAKRELVLSALPLDPPAYVLLYVDILVTAVADCDQLRAYIDRMGGPISERGQLRKACEMLSAREGRVLQVLDQLQRFLGLGDIARSAVMAAAGIGSPAALAMAAQERLRANHAADMARGAANGQDGHHSASEVEG